MRVWEVRIDRLPAVLVCITNVNAQLKNCICMACTGACMCERMYESMCANKNAHTRNIVYPYPPQHPRSNPSSPTRKGTRVPRHGLTYTHRFSNCLG